MTSIRSEAPWDAYLFGVARNYVRRALERNYPESVLSSPIEDEAASLVVDQRSQRRHGSASDIDRGVEGGALVARALSRGRRALRPAGHELCRRRRSGALRDRHSAVATASGARHAQQEAAAFGGGGSGNLKYYGEVRIMTCREFKHSAASLTLWELTRGEDDQVLGHTEKCDACSTWLRKQRTLAVSMQTLQARTAGLEAGPDVERALLRAFRQDTLRSADPVLGE